MTKFAFSKLKVAWIFSSLSLVLVFCAISGGQIPDQLKDKRVESLEKAVVGLTEAYEERNLLKITAWFNSEDVESLGGSERFAELVGLLGSASERTTVSFGSAERVDLVNGKWFGVVTFRMETRITKVLKIAETCLVGISIDDGKTWRFKTGESFVKDYNELVGTIPVIERKVTEEIIVQ